MGIKNRLFKYYFPELMSALTIRRMPTDSGLVLMYHEVLPDEIGIPSWTVVKESDFLWQMDFVQRHFDVVSIKEAIGRIHCPCKDRKPFVLVTFDDGYKGNFNTVLPVMESMGLPFIVYVSTKCIVNGCLFWFDRIINLLALSEDVHFDLTGQERLEHFIIPGKASKTIRRWKAVHNLLERLKMMTPDKREYWVERITERYSVTKPELEMLNVEELHALASSRLVTIGSHTHGHELLDQLDPISIRETILKANRHIVRIIGNMPRHFSYPNGNFNNKVLDIVRDIGFETAVTTKAGVWSRSSDLMKIQRIGIGRFETKGQFMARVSGYL